VDIDCAPAVVAFRDAGRLQVPVEDDAKATRHAEHPRLARQPARHRVSGRTCRLLDRLQPIRQPPAQVFGEVVANRERVTLPVLLIRCVELQHRGAERQVELPCGERPQFVFPQAGQNQRLVHQGPLTPERLQPGFGRRFELCDRHPLLLAPSDGSHVRQWSVCCDRQKPRQFVLGERPTLAPGVGLLVGLGDAIQVVCGHPPRTNAPVRERDHRFTVVVPRPRPHPVRDPVGEPVFDPFAV
jgi:hypothetical protein